MVGHDTGQRQGPGGCQQRTTGEFCGRNEAHSETQPSWELPTSVGFATSAHAKCAFLVLQDFAGLTAVEPGGHPADGRIAVTMCESTLMGQTVSILIFYRLTLMLTSVSGGKAASRWVDSGRNEPVFQFCYGRFGMPFESLIFTVLAGIPTTMW